MAMDPNSFANCQEVRVTDYHIALTADFAQQVLSGTPRLERTLTTTSMSAHLDEPIHRPL